PEQRASRAALVNFAAGLAPAAVECVNRLVWRRIVGELRRSDGGCVATADKCPNTSVGSVVYLSCQIHGGAIGTINSIVRRRVVVLQVSTVGQRSLLQAPSVVAGITS